MELKDKLISSFTTFEQGIDVNDKLFDIRKNALKVFEEKGFPTKKDEAWKYTSLNALLKDDYAILFQNDKLEQLEDVKEYFLSEENTYKLVFVNGVFCPDLSLTTNNDIDVCAMSSAFKDPKYKTITDAYLNGITDKKDSFTALNTAFISEGAFINIPKNKVVEKPIEIIYFTSEEDKATFIQPRNLIVIGDNSQVQITETHQSLTSSKVFTNSVTEIFADKSSIVDYYKIQNDLQTANLIDNTFIEQKRASNVSVHTFSFGGKLTRNNLNFAQNGEGIDSTLKGITMIADKQLVDHYTLVSHNEPNCESHQNYKGIYDDASVGVFNGKIYVDKIAQKTDAFQQNNNILLTSKATINSKPQLEIFADDVKCSHGCTVGQLDENALFYMQQRGIPKKEARALLMYAFTNEALNSVKIPSLKEKIATLISARLGVDKSFDL